MDTHPAVTPFTPGLLVCYNADFKTNTFDCATSPGEKYMVVYLIPYFPHFHSTIFIKVIKSVKSSWSTWTEYRSSCTIHMTVGAGSLARLRVCYDPNHTYKHPGKKTSPLPAE